MRLYMTPGSCTTGIHILLEELDAAGLVRGFEAAIVNLPAGDHRKPDYLALNPKGTIPTLLRDDGTALTDFQSIAFWLARTYPKANFLPEDIEGQTRALEVMNFAVNTIHGHGFARIFTTAMFTPNKQDHDFVQTQGRDIVAMGFRIVEDLMPPQGYVCGGFSIADAALFYVEFWADKLNLELPPKCAAHYQLMRRRPAVDRVLREEGYR